ncbi:MAG: alpha/beta hydrolase-fold protein [Phycisphaerales bacterium]
MILSAVSAALLFVSCSWAAPLRFEVAIADQFGAKPLDGRVLLMISTSGDQETRFQISEGVKSQQIFGVDAEGFTSTMPVFIDADALGYPVESLASIPAGDYFVQALLHKYETFKRADGFTVKLPMDRGEGQHWNRAPGNLYSMPVKVHVDPASATPIRITLDKEIPPIALPKDTKYIKHIRMQSKLLTDFWGRPMELGAVVLIPKGFDEHPDARYPLVINHNHFESTFGEFREEPPDPNLKPEYSERFKMDGYNVLQQQLSHQLFLDWTSEDFPRFVIIKIQHANQFYDDSYAVNSANLGPYGDAIMTELLPAIEKQFRCIGEGWSRFTYGGSTGGWEALAVQFFYPDQFNGCFAACPDPIDFRAYGSVDIYKDKNAYFVQGPWTRQPRPATRDGKGVVTSTLEETNRRELVLGTHSRSGDQWDIWEAVFSPVGPDGYPARIWDKRTGVIDPKVAAYWKEHFDLRNILESDWSVLAPKLQGKIHIYCGTMDNYFLNNAVVLMEDFLKKTNPPYEGLVDYECNAEHCWNGDHANPNGVSRLRYHQLYVETMVKRMQATAPKGADLTSWRYR